MSTDAFSKKAPPTAGADGSFVNRSFVKSNDERFYCIGNVDDMMPFFVSVISSDDHWLFVSSNGGLTAGRVSPETALFPYVPVDRIHDSPSHTGPKTIVRLRNSNGTRYWEPFNVEHRGRYSTTRNLYKNTIGDKLCFEEANHDLDLVFRYTWSTSAEYGFVRDCEILNTGNSRANIDIVDGLQNILPARTPRIAQTNSSNLVDAYKWTEIDEATGLVLLTLYSGITDRAEPCESLEATTAYCLGIDDATILVSDGQLNAFRDGKAPETEPMRRGIRGAFLVSHSLDLPPQASSDWRIVLDLPQDQADVVRLRRSLRSDSALYEKISASIANGSEKLARIMALADGFQSTAEEHVSLHHYANVVFNVLRGGIVADQYNVSADDFRNTVRHFNRKVYERNSELLRALPQTLPSPDLIDVVRNNGDLQLLRLAMEYLPITFGRRHGDPSRPWNEFAIRLKNDDGSELLSYQGNWRDIFQNWEALALSFPEFTENMIAKFVNASTLDGYNPYRITKEGIDWEVEEPDNPWSYIGYWGDHQIIYLLKLLEMSRNFHPRRLQQLLREPVFGYSNVPYRIKPFKQLLEDPKNTVEFDCALAATIDERIEELGADGKLVLDESGDIHQVNLLEKLLVPLLSKLSNLAVDGGIWLNTQRPEWNDANNALVGQGLSMVTLYYMRRYVVFVSRLLDGESGTFDLTTEVDTWFEQTASALGQLRSELHESSDIASLRRRSMHLLGTAACNFRRRIYEESAIGKTTERSVDSVRTLLDDARHAIDHSIRANKRDDGLYHAYNIAQFNERDVAVKHLYPMLEGQVAALSAGTIEPEEAIEIVEALFASAIYRPDQKSFMLYPDRDLPGFLERNQLPRDSVMDIPLLKDMLAKGDERIVLEDDDGCLRFNADFVNFGDVVAALNNINGDYGEVISQQRDAILALYEAVFQHAEFTGRSGSMFGFEGLGSIYWHMVSKLLLALSENFFSALQNGSAASVVNRLGELYYQVRAGLGFCKTPAEYGAFPTDPYSHTPKHAGARQPGMTGQVKEEILTRFAELGIQVSNGRIAIQPALLRSCEFNSEATVFRYLDLAENWVELNMPADSLAFSWCQVPFVYTLTDAAGECLVVENNDGSSVSYSTLSMSTEVSDRIFSRDGSIRQVTVCLSRDRLFDNQ